MNRETNDRITICDLEVHFHVGVTAEERARPQRLLLTVEMTHDFRTAAVTDDLSATIDYAAVTHGLLHMGDGRHWELIETLAVEIAERILEEFSVRTVMVEVKKFVLPQTRYVSVKVTRPIK
jgi:dihydroneopterin aldolase